MCNIKHTIHNMPEEVQAICNTQYTAVCMQYTIHTTWNVLSCDILFVLECKMRIQGAKSKENYISGGVFIKQTTCFGPCIGPSSGLNLCIGGDYTV